MKYLFCPCRHFFLSATIYKRAVSAYTQRCSGGVHTDVSRSYNDRLFRNLERSGAAWLIRFHKIDSGQKLVSRIYAAKIFAFYVQEHRQSRTRTYKYGVVFWKQLVDKNRFTDNFVKPYFYAEFLYVLYFLFHDRFRKSEFGNSVNKNSAGFMQSLE